VIVVTAIWVYWKKSSNRYRTKICRKTFRLLIELFKLQNCTKVEWKLSLIGGVQEHVCNWKKWHCWRMRKTPVYYQLQQPHTLAIHDAPVVQSVDNYAPSASHCYSKLSDIIPLFTAAGTLCRCLVDKSHLWTIIETISSHCWFADTLWHFWAWIHTTGMRRLNSHTRLPWRHYRNAIYSSLNYAVKLSGLEILFSTLFWWTRQEDFVAVNFFPLRLYWEVTSQVATTKDIAVRCNERTNVCKEHNGAAALMVSCEETI